MLLIATLALLASVQVRTQRAASRLADDRAAVHLAESTLITLQHGAVTLPEGVSVKRIDRDATSGRQWVRVTASVRGRSVDLTGLVPASVVVKEDR